jgi:hypothetical protein
MNKDMIFIGAALVAVLAGGASALFAGTDLTTTSAVVAFVLAGIYGVREKFANIVSESKVLNLELKLMEADHFVETTRLKYNKLVEDNSMLEAKAEIMKSNLPEPVELVLEPEAVKPKKTRKK